MYRYETKLLSGLKFIKTHSHSLLYGVGYYEGYGYRLVYICLGHKEYQFQLNGGRPMLLLGRYNRIGYGT